MAGFDIWFQNEYVRAGAILLGSLVLAYLIHFVLKRFLLKLTAKTKTKMDDIAVKRITAPVAVFIIFRKKNITFESFIYIKNKKIMPFFKPIVFGPLSIDINDKKVSKAEFYVNGELKDTLTEAPYIWKFDEPSFMKHKIETKVYDSEGKSNSSGEMTFYIFNPGRPK